MYNRICQFYFCTFVYFSSTLLPSFSDCCFKYPGYVSISIITGYSPCAIIFSPWRSVAPRAYPKTDVCPFWNNNAPPHFRFYREYSQFFLPIHRNHEINIVPSCRKFLFFCINSYKVPDILYSYQDYVAYSTELFHYPILPSPHFVLLCVYRLSTCKFPQSRKTFFHHRIFLYLFFFCIKRFPDFTFCSLDRVIFLIQADVLTRDIPAVKILYMLHC